MKQNSLRKSTLALRTSLILMSGLAPMASHACSGAGDSFIGTICTFAFNFCPSGFLAADGSTLQIRSYSALYALLGTAYGGDGVNTFALPDLRGRMVVGTGTGMINGTPLTPVALGQKDGQEKATLTANNLAPHTHPATVSGTLTGGTVSLPVSGTISGQSITGNVTVNALNGSNPPSGGASLPDSGHNTVGKAGPAIFFPAGSSQVAVPSSHNLTVSGGTVSGTASGPLGNLPISGGTVVVGNNVTTQAPVPTIPPRLGLTTCIATEGVFPMRP